MEFKREGLMHYGFKGFITIRDLRRGIIGDVPENGGVYLVIREIGGRPNFFDKNPGGHFKKKCPTVDQDRLNKEWVNGAHVIYIGKGDNLQERIRMFLRFGEGKPVAHWGGRLIWQIEHSEEFMIAWKEAKPSENPKHLESHVLELFSQYYRRKLPFANLRR